MTSDGSTKGKQHRPLPNWMVRRFESSVKSDRLPKQISGMQLIGIDLRKSAAPKLEQNGHEHIKDFLHRKTNS